MSFAARRVQEIGKVKITELADGQCIAWSANLKKAPERLDRLLAYVRTLERLPGIIAIQDPPIRVAFKSCAPFRHWCRAVDEEELKSEDNPTEFPYKPPYSRDPLPTKQTSRDLAKIAFLVHFSLSDWRVVEPDGRNRGIYATIILDTPGGTIACHNIYNHEDNVCVDELLETCHSTTEIYILLGDFNLHHQL